MALTPKQQRFVDEYLIDLNATQAAIRAGYSPKSADKIGPKLVGKSSISEAIAAALDAREKRTGVTQDFVVKKLVQNLERSLQETPVLDHEGNPTGEYRYEGSVANKALELLGKHLGMFTEKHKHEVSGPDGKPIQNEHVISIPDRIDQLASAFEEVADRTGEGGPAGHGP